MCWQCSRLIFVHISSLWASAEQNAWQCLKMALTTWLQMWQHASCHVSGSLEKKGWGEGREEEFSEEQSENRWWWWVTAMMLQVMKKTEDWPQRTTKSLKFRRNNKTRVLNLSPRDKVSQKKGWMLISHLNYIFSLVFLTNTFSESQIKQLKLHAGTLDWFNIHRTRQIFSSWPLKDHRPIGNNRSGTLRSQLWEPVWGDHWHRPNALCTTGAASLPPWTL